ncbi:MAG TPA: efflux RND transporter periplasmic adaptor subunit [Xanthobacteraceae bacterium]|nr:efflux RND transporter periplasmic adaptor subunit [Xanthobacteraceae bacterium]
MTVSKPLQQNLDRRLGFLGQFSAVNRIELRAQVGGTLTEIHFQDGQIVRKGDLLFVIDPRPYEIKLALATAQLATATARADLASAELVRAQTLRNTQSGSQEVVDQRLADHNAAQAAVDDAKAQIRDAQLDLEYCRVTAPFDGSVGARQVSIGGLIAGSRASASPTTLLATLVSLDPIYVDFDMSESDYLTFARGHEHNQGALHDKVLVALSDEKTFLHEGTLDFIDNALDRSSGTLHARATVPNRDMFLAPGQFARVRLAVSPPSPVLMVPDAAVTLDQSQQIVMTVAPDGTVTPKIVEIGEIRGGLRIIRSGLKPDDEVIIGGLIHAAPGAKVATDEGAIKYDPALAGQD